MEDVYNTLLFDDTPTEQPSVRRKLDEDPELARAWAHWCAVRSRIRDRLTDQLPESRLLVLYALEAAGHESALSEAEREALAAARGEIEHALDAVPALTQVVESIQDDQEAFEETWAAQTDGTSGRRGRDMESRSADRAERPARPSARRSRSAVQRWTRRVAVAALLVGVAVLAMLYWPQDDGLTTVTVDEGEMRMVDLTDDTTVRLAGGAILSYPSNLSDAEGHRVTLREGRAYFDVQRRADGSSFAVETPTATATVLGTQFGVLTGGDTTAVVLAEGKVEIGARDESTASSVTLKPGQRSHVERGRAPTTPVSVDLTTALDWTGLLVFRSTPVATIAERLQRHYAATVSVAPALQDAPVSGTFDQDQSIEDVLGTLAKTLNAEVQSTTEGQYQLVPNP